MKFSCTGVILAGGENKRFYGENKAFAKVGSLRIFDKIFNLFCKIFKEIIIVTNSPLDYVNFDCCIITDHYVGRSSINGIHAGLFSSQENHSFFIACDTPFPSQKLIELIINKIKTNKDIIIPKTILGFEPLFAVYSKKCLRPIENQIKRGDFKISKLFNKVRVERINEVELRKEDPYLTSFFNVNRPIDLVQANCFYKNNIM